MLFLIRRGAMVCAYVACDDGQRAGASQISLCSTEDQFDTILSYNRDRLAVLRSWLRRALAISWTQSTNNNKVVNS
jgi:hypothetical protein